MESSVERAKTFYRNLPPVNFNLADATEANIFYGYFKYSTPNIEKALTVRNVEEENLEKTIPTVLFIHGYMCDDSSPWYGPLKDEYFKLGRHNIIYTNWGQAASRSYEVSCANVKVLGSFAARFLIKSGVPQGNIQIVAHSLGAQLASFIGKEIFKLSGKKLGRITAMDPAGPKFENAPMETLTLCSADADFVDVIHTDIQLFGHATPIGHVDFYANEGKHQPGCPPRTKDVNCSHVRSILYFIESFTMQCKTREAVFNQVNNEVTVKVLDGGKEVIFGQHVDKTARGIFFFRTNSVEPFLC